MRPAARFREGPRRDRAVPEFARGLSTCPLHAGDPLVPGRLLPLNELRAYAAARPTARCALAARRPQLLDLGEVCRVHEDKSRRAGENLPVLFRIRRDL